VSENILDARRAAVWARPLTVAAAVALLSGCYSYRIERVDNPVKLPVSWDFQQTPGAPAAVSNRAVDVEWWKSFGSPVLNDLIAQALKDNPGIIATEERLKQAERAYQQNRDALLPDPRLSTGLNVGYADGNQRSGDFTESTSAISLSASYTVDLWGSRAANFRTQTANFIGTQYDTQLARINLAAQVAQAYFRLLSTRSRTEIARRNLAIAEDLLRIAQVRFDNGVLRQFDLTQQTTQLLSTRSQLITQENQVRREETALGLLLGRTPQEFRVEGEPIEQLQVPEIAPWVPADLLLRRADLAGAELDMANARANVAAVRAALIPVSLSLSANASNSGSDQLFKLTDTRNFSLSGALSIAEGFFSFKQKRNNVLNAESNEYIALINYAQTIRTALKEVDDLLATAATNQRSEEIQRESLANSRRSFELVEVELREGSATGQELREAQRALYQAEDSLSTARLNRLTTAIQLYQTLGGGWTPPPANPDYGFAPDRRATAGVAP
jgi:outer membrane protein, multidrug efflux system